MRTLAKGMRMAALAITVCSAAAMAAIAQPAGGQLLVQAGAATLRALEAALLLSGQEGGTIRIAVLAAALPIASGEPGVHLLAEIDGAGLLTEGGPTRPRLDLFVYALDTEREVVGSTSRRLDLDSDRYRKTVSRTGVKMPIEMPLPPGEYDLRILVRTGDGAFGVRSAPLSIPHDPPEPGLPAPPLFPEPHDRWLIAVGSLPPSPHPFVRATDEASLPAALPVASSAAPARGHLLVQGLGPVEPVLTALLKRNDTGELLELAMVVGNRHETPFPGVESVEFELPTGELEPGVYTLRVALGRAGSGPAATPSSVLIVAPAGPLPAWTELELEGLDGEPPRRLADAGRPRVEPDSGKQLPRQEIDSGLDEVFSLLGAGDFAAAATALRELHRKALGGPGASYGVLLGAETTRIARLRQEGWDDLLPVLCLYAELSRGYAGHRRLGLADHAAAIATKLAHTYARSRGTDQARADAATILESLAAAAMSAGVLSAAADHFESALSLDANRPLGLLGLAAVREKQGHHRDAAELLERFVRLRPDHREGGLRLGVNLWRSGRAARAAEVLDQLLDQPGPAWVTILAFQERARQELLAGRHEGAREILRRAVKRWPDDPSLKIQLAWLIEVGTGRKEADRLVTSVDHADAGLEPSPRSRYDAWPREVAAIRPTGLLGHGADPAGGAATPPDPGG